jgi:flagellar biosynthesis GTPase FlhF
MPQLDPNNPMAAMLAMQQALGLFPGLPNGNGVAQRCRDYDTKGFCTAGASCPHEHGNDPVLLAGLNQEYDPNNAMMLNIQPSRTGHMNFAQNERGRGGPRGRARGVNNFRGGGRRSQHSQLGPSRDPSNTAIVVESIPKDKCDEQSVRDFFSEFGNIDSVTVEFEKKLAIINYDSHDAAKAAYESPKVVFDNRFVKVFWYKSEKHANPAVGFSNLANGKSSPDVEMQNDIQFDAVELVKKQEEAQRKHEEAKKQREEVTKQRQDLEAQLKATEEEKRKMADLIAKKTSKAQTPQTESSTQNGTVESEQTKGLKAQLAKLEAEAKSLGLNPYELTNGNLNGNGASFRGRGGFRGRVRGRGYHSGYRGGWSTGRGGAVMRLDNRPKTVAVTFTEGSYGTHEEALRQFLLFNSLDSANLSKYPDRDDTALVTFAQRFEGENFMKGATNSELLHIGKVELSWYKQEDKATTVNGNHEMDTAMDHTETIEHQPTHALETEEYGMTEDEDLDHWS